MSLPHRVYVCGFFCGYNTPYRWALRDHLIRRHHIPRREAYEQAYESEYHLTLNPAPRYVNPLDDFEEEIGEEDEE